MANVTIFTRFISLILFLSCFCFSDARIDIKDYGIKKGDQYKFNVWPGVEEGNSYAQEIPFEYSLFWGTVMFYAGFLEALRLRGNFEKNTNTREVNGRTVVDRRDDEGKDGLEKLVIQLFPSNLAEVEKRIQAEDIRDSLWNHISSLSKEKQLIAVALLMVRAEIFRILIDKKAEENLLNDVLSELNGKEPQECDQFIDQKYGPQVRRKETKNQVRVYQALQAESQFGYAKYTVEHVILAFICELLNSEDVPKFLKIWADLRKKIFTKKYLDNTRKIDGREEEIEEIAKIHKTFIDVIGPIPYNRPVNQGSANKLHYMEGRVIPEKTGTFSDCMETSIRHTINYVLGTEGMARFNENKEKIRNRVRDEYTEQQRLSGDRLDALGEFYQETSNRNGGDRDTRTCWNAVVFDLNREYQQLNPSSSPIVYVNKENELKTNILNFVKAIATILGVNCNAIELSPKACDKLLGTLLSCLKLDETECEIFGYKFEEKEGSDLVTGDIKLRVKHAGVAPYEFTIHQVSGHGWVVNNINNIEILFSDYDGAYKNLCGYLFPYYKGQNIYHTIFSFYSINIDEELIRSIIFYQFAEVPDDIKSAVKRIVKNQLSLIPLSDKDTARGIHDKIAVGCEFNNRCYKSIVELVENPRYLPNVLKEVSLDFNTFTGEWLDVLNNEDIEDLRLINYKTQEDVSLSLRSLNCLEMNNVQITGNCDLSNLTALSLLIVIKFKVNHISFPSSLKLLQIYDTEITRDWDLSKLSLIDLSLSDCKIRGDISFPPDSLNTLKMSNVQITGNCDLSKLEHLEEVSIEDSEINTIQFSQSLKRLKILNSIVNNHCDLSGSNNIEKLQLDSTLLEKFTIPNSLMKITHWSEEEKFFVPEYKRIACVPASTAE
jgi:hypothetical protein